MDKKCYTFVTVYVCFCQYFLANPRSGCGLCRCRAVVCRFGGRGYVVVFCRAVTRLEVPKMGNMMLV